MTRDDDEKEEPELTEAERHQVRELLRASNSIKALTAFMRVASKWIIAVAGAVAIIRYLIVDYFGGGKH